RTRQRDDGRRGGRAALRTWTSSPPLVEVTHARVGTIAMGGDNDGLAGRYETSVYHPCAETYANPPRTGCQTLPLPFGVSSGVTPYQEDCVDLSLYRALIESAVPKSITATTYLYIPDSSLRPGDVLRYNPARPHHVYRPHAVPITASGAAHERAGA